MIFTSLSPNTQKDDFKLALKVLFKTSEYKQAEYRERVRKWFQEYFNVKYVNTYESARTALYFIFKNFGIGEGDEVIVQAFTCVAAVNPIKWTKARPVFIDINPENFNLETNDLENKITEKTKAIIVQHTFGYPAPIEEVLKIAKGKGIYVIEDCAHSIGTEFNGEKLGIFGDAAVFSLGRDKAISASFGGIAITKQKALGKRLKEQEKFLSFPSKKWIARQLLYTIIAYLTRNLYDKLFLGKLIHLLAFNLGLVRRATTYGEKCEGKMPSHAKSQLPNVLAKIAFNQLMKIDLLNNSRKEFTKLYFEGLKTLKEVRLPNWDLKNFNKFYPIRVPLVVKNRDGLLEYAKQKDILLGDWYDVPVAPKEVDLLSTGYKSGSCPKAEEVCKRVVNLPLNVNMTKEDVEKVIAVIKEYYK